MRPQPSSGSYVTRMDDIELWRELGQQFRVDSVRCAAAAKSGHPTSGMSAADLMSVLLAEHLHYDFDAPDAATNDRLIFSKGHASTLLYAMFRAADAISDEEMLTYRQFGSMLEGHPTPLIPWVDVATGSLGQGSAARRWTSGSSTTTGHARRRSACMRSRSTGMTSKRSTRLTLRRRRPP